MDRALASLTTALMRQVGRLVHAVWIGLCAVATLIASPASLGEITLLGLAALPGLAGLVLAGPDLDRSRTARFVLALSWTLPGVVACFGWTEAISPAAFVFMAGPVALAAAASPRAARFAAGLSALAFILVAVLGLWGPLLATPVEALTEPVLWAGLAGYIALCGLVARSRLEHALYLARRSLRELRPAAEGFARAPRPLVALSHDGTITAASRALHRVAPGAPRNLEGLPLDGLGFDEADAESVRAGLASAGAGGGADGGCFSFAVRAADGRQTPLDARAVATPAGFVVALETPRARGAAPSDSVDTLKAERDAALAADRSKSEFLAAVSHELRTPLNAIIGFSDVMKQRLFGPLPARYAEYSDLIHQSGGHLLELIGDVLDMSKIEADRYELDLDRFDARDVVEICAKMLRLRAEEAGLVLYSDVGDSALEVDADRKAMRQILLNLLSNAIKFTPQGGAVVVMARAEGRDLVLAVGDSGEGIEPEALATLGQAYTQSKSGRNTVERGTGLGLSLVHALAELHGGTTQITSAPGEGTTVTVRLPVLVEAEVTPLEHGDGQEDQPLDVHAQIRAAQEAGEALIETKAKSA